MKTIVVRLTDGLYDKFKNDILLNVTEVGGLMELTKQAVERRAKEDNPNDVDYSGEDH